MSFPSFRRRSSSTPLERAVLAGVLAAALPACEPELCGQRCGSDGSCPSGFVCGTDATHCVPASHPDACGALGAPSGTEPEPEPNSSEASTEASDSEPSALPMTAGELRIEAGASSGESCQGSEFLADFHVREEPGRAYAWRLLRAPSGLALSSDRGADVQLSGRPSEPGSYAWDIEVSDDTGAVGRLPFSLLVRARPRILTTELPAVCPGEIYRASLRAEGAADGYTWTTDLPGASGLGVAAQELAGRYSGSGPPGELSLALSARDQFCESSARATLEVLEAGSERCPVVEAAEGELREQLPEPCLGNDYEAHLGVRQANTEARYQWQAVQTPPGLFFDPATARVSGRALGAGELVVRVTDAQPRSIEARFAVTPRARCWFGYLAGQAGARRLELLDARLSHQASARRAHPPPTQPGDVLDFAFAPGGRWLAYRLQQAGATRLWLLDLHSWQEQALDFEGTVTRYTWGPAASWLALSWSAQGAEHLAALRLDSLPDDPLASTPPSVLSGATRFESASTPLLAAPLWLGESESVALVQSAADPYQWMLQFVRYGAGGAEFLAPHDEFTFSDQAWLQRGAEGVFVLDEPSGFHDYFPSDGARFTAHSQSAIVSPSGRFVARAAAGQLQLFRPGDASWSDDAVPWAAADGCSSLLAWAEGRERIACARALAGEQQIVFYELPDPAQPLLIELPRVQGEYSYATGEHIGRPRAFSRQGDRFAFTTAAGAYAVKLDDGTPRVERALGSNVLGTEGVPLSFSPGGELLSLHAGSNLVFWSMTHSSNYYVILEQAVGAPPACSEAFAKRDVDWCGSSPRRSVMLWSGAGDLLAYRSAAGALELQDVSFDFPEHKNEVHATLTCGSSCSAPDAYAFQP